MANLNIEVNQNDLQQLSAMLDGEISAEALDLMLKRMEQEPALGEAWGRLSQIQAACHRHLQAGFEVDLSDRIAQKLKGSVKETTPTPVISLRTARQEGQSKVVAEHHAALTSEACFNKVLDVAPYNGVDRRKSAVIPKQKKGFKQQMLAHLAVAASVASITVWFQNDLIQGPEIMAGIPATYQGVPAPATGPALVKFDQQLPLETVGNDSQKESETMEAKPESNARVEAIGGSSQ